jgi:hypothetical protein
MGLINESVNGASEESRSLIVNNILNNIQDNSLEQLDEQIDDISNDAA